MPLYEQIGQGYDITRRADPYIADRLTHHLHVNPIASYLDVACGTGNYTVALAKSGGFWYGVDCSQLMIDSARDKSDDILWQVAGAEALPYPDATFSGILCTLAIHHFNNLNPVFREVHRVLSAGRFVLFTATPEQMNKYWLVEYFPDAIRRSAEQMPNLEIVKHVLDESGFDVVETEPYSIQATLQDLFLYSGKHRPEFYLDAAVRSGISTFALLASATEVEAGCQRLAADIRTGAIAEVMKKYQHARGDYLFVIASKNSRANLETSIL